MLLHHNFMVIIIPAHLGTTLFLRLSWCYNNHQIYSAIVWNRIYYDLETHSQPINMAYIGGSVTSFKNVNPGYRIYRYACH
jgi:hypothetical protein